MSERRLLLVSLAALVVATAATALAVTSSERSDAAGQPERRLDDVPGYGLSTEAVLRDETIAYWEAWRRDRMVQDCMRTAGFDWKPEALYSTDDVHAIAANLGVRPSTADAARQAPESQNAQLVETLDVPEQDRFYEALYGESAEAVAYAGEHGGKLPPGRSAEDFASGGCRGDSDRALPGIWEIKHLLGEELLALREEQRDEPEFKAAQRNYMRCMTDHGLANVASPRDVDAALADGAVATATSAATECDPIWQAAAQHAEEQTAKILRETHGEVIDKHKRQYDGVLDRIRTDAAFTLFLANAAARA